MTNPTDLPTLVLEIARQLGETKAEPLAQIERAVELCGPDVMQAILRETLDLEARGGMMLPDGSRRRTPGGVFFHLLRQRVSQAEWRRVRLLPPEPSAPPKLPFRWEDRAEAVREAAAQPGEATTAKLMVVGRPSEVRDHEAFVIATLDGGEKIPDIPRGVPRVASLPTTYRVFIPGQQWRPIEAALRNPQDVLVAEGYAYPHDKAHVILILAQKATTAGLQAAQRGRQKGKGMR